MNTISVQSAVKTDFQDEEELHIIHYTEYNSCATEMSKLALSGKCKWLY